MLINNRIVNNQAVDQKIGPIRTADIRKTIDSVLNAPPKTYPEDSPEFIIGDRGILIHEITFDILNPFI
jgi:hypothetical protein